MIVSNKNAFVPHVASEIRSPSVEKKLITLLSGVEPDFLLLSLIDAHETADSRLHEWIGFDCRGLLEQNTFPLPKIANRECYYGPDHFSYWASGLQNARYMFDWVAQRGTSLNSSLGMGCASVQMLSQMALNGTSIRGIGCDTNTPTRNVGDHCALPNCTTVQNHSAPTLPLEENSIEMVWAFSVFTHIEALETAWQPETWRLLRAGCISCIMGYIEHMLADMAKDWPLCKPVPNVVIHLDAQRNFVDNRLIMPWYAQRSCLSNVIYKSDYLQSSWTRILGLIELRGRFRPSRKSC